MNDRTGSTETGPRQLTAGGKRLAVSLLPGDGTPLLICNGLGAGLRFLDPLVDALEGLPVIRYDAPGIGASGASLSPYRLPDLARCLVDVLDQLGHDRVDLLGISWGGALAQELALNHPERVRRLVLAASTMGALGAPASPLSAWLLLHPAQIAFPGVFKRLAGLIHGGRVFGRPARGRGSAPVARAGDVAGMALQLLAITGWTSAHRLHRIGQPTLLLASATDPLAPLINHYAMQYLIPDATLEMIDGGHLFAVERADATAAAISAFVRRRSTRRGRNNHATQRNG